MFTHLRKLLAFATALTLLPALSACSPKRDLTEYQQQVISWEKCDSELLKPETQSEVFKASTVECTTMLVPATYSGLEKGKDYKLQLMRIHQASAEAFKGSIFINPGGPGGSGIEQLQYSEFPAELVANYDIIGFDPRGVGASDFADGSEIKCSDELDFRSYFEGEMSPANLKEIKDSIKASDNYYKDCVKRNPLWWTLSTDHVIDDLELMRAVVTGEKDLNFIGSSYGTTIAGMYVTKYPTHVGKIVLDSPTTVDNDPVASDVEDAKAMEGKLRIYLTAYADHAGITFDQAWRRLLKYRQLADDNKIIGFAGFHESKEFPGYHESSEALITRGIQALSYMPESDAIEFFNEALDSLEQDNWNGVFEWLAFNMDGYDPNTLKGANLADKKLVRSNQFEIMVMVRTMDYSPAEQTVDDQKDAATRIEAVSPMWTELNSDASGYSYFGPSLGLSWEKIARDDPFIPDPPTEVKVRSNRSGKKLLIVGSLYESVTPFAFAKDTAKALKSPLIAVESEVHGPVAGYDVPCLNKIIIDYFVNNLTIESQTCSKK